MHRLIRGMHAMKHHQAVLSTHCLTTYRLHIFAVICRALLVSEAAAWLAQRTMKPSLDRMHPPPSTMHPVQSSTHNSETVPRMYSSASVLDASIAIVRAHAVCRFDAQHRIQCVPLWILWGSLACLKLPAHSKRRACLVL